MEDMVSVVEDWGVEPQIELEKWHAAFDEFWRKRGLPLAIDVRGRPVWCRDSGVVSEQISERV